MRQVALASILVSFALSFLAGIHTEFFDGRSSFSQVSAAAMEAVPTDAEHTTSRSAWHHPMRNVSKRGKGTLTLISGPVRSITTSDAHLLAHACSSSLAGLSQTAPLYQSLQVFRF